MPFSRMLRHNSSSSLAVAALLSLAILLSRISGAVEAELFSIVGSQGSGTFASASAGRALAWKNGPRVSVFETDVWRHSLQDGSFEPVAQLPMPPAFSLWHALRRRPAPADL